MVVFNFGKITLLIKIFGQLMSKVTALLILKNKKIALLKAIYNLFILHSFDDT